MNPRRQRKRKPARTAHARSSKYEGPVFFKSPLSDIPRDEFRDALLKRGADAAHEFPSLLAQVLDVLRQVEPLQALSMLSKYGLMTTLDNAEKPKALPKEGMLTQAHVELAQALVW